MKGFAFFMNRRGVRAAVAGCLALGVGVATTLACGGTPPPPVCGATLVIVKPPFGVVTLPGGGPGTFNVSVTLFLGLTPGSPPCPAPPYNANVTLNVNCGPAGGGGSGTTTTTLTPGFNTVSVPVSVGAGPPRFCLVTGTATVTLTNGTTVTATGDTAVCIGEPAPNDPTVPRLDLQNTGDQTVFVHPGDQATHTYRITNNDPDETFEGTLTVTSANASRLPSEGTPSPPGDGPYAISDPGDADAFPMAFTDALSIPVENIPSVDAFGDPDNFVETVELPANALITGVGWLTTLEAEEPSLLSHMRVEVTDTDIAAGIGLTPGDEDDFAGASTYSSGGLVDLVDLDLDFNVGEDGALRLEFHELEDDAPDQADGHWLSGDLHIESPDLITCVELPPDPQNQTLSEITRQIILPPGQSIDVEVFSRPWGMCANGSCNEQTVVLEGTYTDGTEGIACAGGATATDTSQPPQYEWPDSGAAVQVQPVPDGLVHHGQPAPDVFWDVVSTLPQDLTLTTDKGQPPIVVESFSQPLSPEWGRVESQIFRQDGQPLFFVDSFFDITYRIDFQPADPDEIQTEIIAMDLVGGAPTGFENIAPFAMGEMNVDDLTGGEPLTTFGDIFWQVSGEGFTKTGQPLPIEILSLDFEPDPAGVNVHLTGQVIPENPPTEGTVEIEPIFGLRLVNDFRGYARAGQAAAPPPCPGDFNGDGVVDGADLGLLLGAWGDNPGSAADLNGDDVVDGADLGLLLGAWGPCP